MRTILLIILLGVILKTQLLSQQLPLFSQSVDFQSFINPAFIAPNYFASKRQTNDRYWSVGVSYRNQWIKNQQFNSRSIFAKADLMFNKGWKGGTGPAFVAGLQFLNDQVGFSSIDAAYLRGALFLGDPTRFILGAGFNAGVLFHTIDLEVLERKTFEPNDPLFLTANPSANAFDLGIGILGSFKLIEGGDRMLTFGLSMPQILGEELRFSLDNDFSYKQERHFYATIGLFWSTVPRFRPANPKEVSYFYFQVTVQYLKGLEYQADVTFRYQILNYLLFGAGLNTELNFHFEFGAPNISLGPLRLRIIYGIEKSFESRYAIYAGLSHEINLSFLIVD